MFKYGKGICYSGYREGQSPIEGIFPTFNQVYEDLQILEGEFSYIRLYDLTPLTYTVLEVIMKEEIELKVLLGVYLFAEINHKNHTIFGRIDAKILEENRKLNKKAIQEGIQLAKQYSDCIIGISVANESRSYWNVNRVSISSLIEYVKTLKHNLSIPVTFCEETRHWIEELEELAKQVDFISFHTYPSWNDTPIDKALDYVNKAHFSMKRKYPEKELVITETGWPTKSHGGKMPISWACVNNQKLFLEQLTSWAKDKQLTTFIFEAFDEPWKGGDVPDEPEKNWGLYDVRRKLK